MTLTIAPLLTSKSHEVGEKSMNVLPKKEILHGKEWQEILLQVIKTSISRRKKVTHNHNQQNRDVKF